MAAALLALAAGCSTTSSPLPRSVGATAGTTVADRYETSAELIVPAEPEGSQALPEEVPLRVIVPEDDSPSGRELPENSGTVVEALARDTEGGPPKVSRDEAPTETTPPVEGRVPGTAPESDWPIVVAFQVARSLDPEPVHDILLSAADRPDIEVRVDGGEIHAVVTGSIGSRPQIYSLDGAAGQTLEAALLAPPGAWLEVRLGDEVVHGAEEQVQEVGTVLATGGELRLSVVSAGQDPGVYELTIHLLPPVPEPIPEVQVPTVGRARIESGSVVYLTFDDGPHPTHTLDALDILARHGARATFFVVGSLVEKYPDVFQRIVSEGHTVANHTWRHENLTGLSRSEFDETIGRTQDILGAYATPCLRPPYAATGRYTREWATEHGLDVHLWTVSANDWLGLNASEIADRIVSQVTGGSVVLMHDGGGNRTQTVKGLEMILARLTDLHLRYEPLCVISGP